MNIRETTITPAIASKMLKRNSRNRAVNKRHVRFLAKEMEQGRWKLNGDAIRLNGDMLIDGQHRLHACIESGISFETILIEGISSDVFDTIDIGKSRSSSDALYVAGEKNTVCLAAALNIVYRYVRSELNNPERVSPSMTEDELVTNPGIRDYVNTASCLSGPQPLQKSFVAAFHYLFSLADKPLSDDFFEQLISGVNIEKDSPVLMLRQRLIANQMNKQMRLSRTFIIAITIKTWNAVYLGKDIKQLKWSQKEGMPSIAGFPDSRMKEVSLISSQ